METEALKLEPRVCENGGCRNSWRALPSSPRRTCSDLCDREHAIDGTAWSYKAARHYVPTTQALARMRLAKKLKAQRGRSEFESNEEENGPEAA